MIFVYRTSAVGPSGTSIGDIDVETEILLNENVAPVNYIIVNQGKPGDIYDDSCEGTWLLRKDIAENRQWHSSNVNDYANSTVHAYLNGDWLDRYDPDVVEAIIQAKIPYVNGTGSGGSVASGANGLSVKAFLLGAYEVGFSTSDNQYFPVDGIKLSYFEAGTGSSANQKRIATLAGLATAWWLRAPNTVGTGGAWRTYADGNYSSYSCSNSYGIRPALILPFDFKLSDDQIVGVTA